MKHQVSKSLKSKFQRKLRFRWSEHDLGVKNLKFSPCGNFLFSIGLDKKMVIWNTRNQGSIVVVKNFELDVEASVWRSLPANNPAHPPTLGIFYIRTP